MVRILIVEDESVYCESLTHIFQSEGYEIRCAYTARQAEEVAADFRPDALVVDWMLGEQCDGGQLAERLRAGQPDLKTIVITGYPDLRPKIAACEAVDEVLEKPFSREQIVAAVRRVLG